MNTEAQRVAIALAVGYRRETMPAGEIEWTGPNREDIGRFHPETVPSALPDYLSDLNAMHVAEKVLFLQDYGPLYGEWLEGNWHATAAQRAEAFLRTLGLWIES